MVNNDLAEQIADEKAQSSEELIRLLRSLQAKLSNVEKIILARSNGPLSFEKQVLARLDEILAWQTTMEVHLLEANVRQPATPEYVAELRAEMQAEFASISKVLAKLKEESDVSFRKTDRIIELLCSDVLAIRANYSLIEKILLPLEEEDIEALL